jgi:hypothetical protein
MGLIESAEGDAMARRDDAGHPSADRPPRLPPLPREDVRGFDLSRLDWIPPGSIAPIRLSPGRWPEADADHRPRAPFINH